MAISQEEVRFGVVPGLAKLLNSMGTALARTREREHQTRLADISAGTKSRAAAAGNLDKLKNDARILTNRNKNRRLAPVSPGELPKAKTDDFNEDGVITEDEVTLDEEGIAGILKQPGMGAFLNIPTSPEDQRIFQDIDRGMANDEKNVGELTEDLSVDPSMDDQLREIIRLSESGETMRSDQQMTLNRVKGFLGTLDQLDGVAENAAKFGEDGIDIIDGANFIKDKLNTGEMTPEMTRMKYGGPFTIMDIFEASQLTAGNAGDAAKIQDTLAQLQQIPNPTPEQQNQMSELQGRIQDMQGVAVDPRIDTRPEQIAEFAKLTQQAAQWNADWDLISQAPSAAISGLSGVELNPGSGKGGRSETRAVDGIVNKVDGLVERKYPGDEILQAREKAQFRQDLAQHIKEGGNAISGVTKILGAEMGRAARIDQIQQNWATNTKYSANFATRQSDVMRAAALKDKSITPAQAEFVGQASAATQLPPALLIKLSKLDENSAGDMIRKLKAGLRGATSSDRIAPLDEDKVKALNDLYDMNGLGRSGVSKDILAVTQDIFAAYPAVNPGDLRVENFARTLQTRGNP